LFLKDNERQAEMRTLHGLTILVLTISAVGWNGASAGSRDGRKEGSIFILTSMESTGYKTRGLLSARSEAIIQQHILERILSGFPDEKMDFASQSLHAGG
jgi:hypothetical protein